MACVQNPSAGVSGQRLEDHSLANQPHLTGGFKVSEIPSPKEWDGWGRRSESKAFSGLCGNVHTSYVCQTWWEIRMRRIAAPFPKQLSFSLAVESSLLSSLNICQTLQHPDMNQFSGFPLFHPLVCSWRKWLWNDQPTRSFISSFLSSFLSIKPSSFARLIQVVIMLFYASDSWIKVKPIKILKRNCCNFIFDNSCSSKFIMAAMECWFNSNNTINLQIGLKKV